MFGKEKELPQAPIARARALSAAYLPELTEPVSELEGASREYEIWMLQAGQKRWKKDQDMRAGFEEAYQKYLDANTTTMTKILDFQKNYLN